MDELGKSFRCLKCGHASFRYSRKDRQSYCLTCGTQITPESLMKVTG